MADVKISALSAAAAVTSADLIPIVQADETKRATIGQIIDLVSNSISIISNAASAADAHASVASVAVTSVDARVNTVSNTLSTVVSGASARSVGNVSTHGHQSILNALSNRISVAAGGSASPTSNEYSVLSQAHSALSQAHSALSQIVSVMSTTLSNAISQIASVEIHASTASAAATSADAHAAAASAAATSADAHASAASAAATSVLAGISAASARSVGDVSTHGLQSVVNALSNRISTVAGGAGSVTSTEASAISQNASAAMGSVRSVGDVSTQGRQSILNALSGRISHTQSLLSQAISVVSQAVSVVSTAASNALSVANAASNAASVVSNAASNALSAASAASQNASVNDASIWSAVSVIRSVASARSVGNVSTHGHQSILDALSNRISVAAGGSAVPSSAQYVSLASTVSHLASIVSNVSAQSAGGSATGLQNVINMLSNKISQGGGAGSVTSTELSAHSAALSVRAFSATGSANTSVKGHQSVINQISNTFSNSMSAGSVVRANVSVLSQRLSTNALLSAQTRFTDGLQSINASALTNVSGLSVSVEAGGMYEIDGAIFLSTSAPTTVGLRAGFTFPALAASRGGGRFMLASINQAGSVDGAGFNLSVSGSVLLSVTNTGMIAGERGHLDWLAYFIVSAGGVVQLQIAGVASTAQSPWHILSGSFIRSRRMR